MKELVVVSGKGGTGKTTVVGALASLAKNKVLVDCDVDAANLHLLLHPDIQATHEFRSGEIARIDTETCESCGLCYDVCRFEAIRIDEGNPTVPHLKFRVEPVYCEGCSYCARVCPSESIVMETAVSGEWFVSQTRFGPFFHGRLGVAQSNSGKLVTRLRQEARSATEQDGADLIIIDGPPGIGCPAIASLTGAAYVLIISEPTMSAFHDLERVVQLAHGFGIPIGIAINKADINPNITRDIMTFANERRIDILGTLPYDGLVTEAQVAGKTIIEYADNDLTDTFKSLWTKLDRILQNVDNRSGQKIVLDNM